MVSVAAQEFTMSNEQYDETETCGRHSRRGRETRAERGSERRGGWKRYGSVIFREFS